MDQHSFSTETGLDFGLEEAASVVQSLRGRFSSRRTRPLSWRDGQLKAFQAMLSDRQDIFHEALRADLGRCRFEAWIAETGFLANEAAHVRKHLRAWTRPERVFTPLVHQPGRSTIRREPLGVVLIIGPWNYPLQLVLAPLVGAIAAGNCAVLKPSELAPNTAAAIAEWIPEYLDAECVRVVQGGVQETEALLAQRFDHIFYTGSGRVGRVVMEAAAKHLTPVTLELGGKSPVVVDRDVDLERAARRIAWGKFFNAGQTCVSPDYALVDRAIEADFVERLRANIRAFYGSEPRSSPDYARVVNDRHFARLQGLLQSGRVAEGGDSDPDERYIAPTILREVPDDAPVMQDEIFGPILPVVPVDGVKDAIARINARPKPLALYVFSKRQRAIDDVIEQTSSGGVCVNDTLAHLSIPDLPFGGVGESGMGAYHGRESFEVFSHRRGVLEKGTRIDPALRYPPYDEHKLKWAKRLV